MESDLQNAAYVDADRRQDPARGHSVDEPFVARHALSYRPRPNDLVDVCRLARSPDRFRFRGACAATHWRDDRCVVPKYKGTGQRPSLQRENDPARAEIGRAVLS